MFDSSTRTLVVVGAQWGDEGKGKLVDVLAERADWVVRYQGGANAGAGAGNHYYFSRHGDLVPSGAFPRLQYIVCTP